MLFLTDFKQNWEVSIGRGENRCRGRRGIPCGQTWQGHKLRLANTSRTHLIIAENLLTQFIGAFHIILRMKSCLFFETSLASCSFRMGGSFLCGVGTEFLALVWYV